MFDFVSAGFCRGNSVGSEQQRRAAMICEGCSVKFTVFKRRRQCSVCQRYYCSHCLPLGQNSNSNTSTSVLARFTDKKLKCSKCEVLTARPLCRSQLRQLRVKDLQHYLTLQQVSTRGCVEKDDLVNLLIRHAGNSSNNTQKYDPVGDHTSYTNIQYGNRPSTVQHQPEHYQQQQEQREQHSFPSAPHSSTHCFPSTSESSHNNDCLGSSVSNERTTATTSGESNTGNNSGCQNETSASDTSASQESTCHISTSSSSSSTDSNREWLGQSSAAAINIVELTDSVDDLSSSESGPEPVITIIEDDAFERVATEVRRMSLSDEPINPADSVSSAPEESATPHVTEVEFMEVDEGSSVEITDMDMDSSNDQNVSPDEIVLDDTSDAAATDPVITTQACTGITLASISSLEDLEKLSVKQLKELLSLNRVDYRGCCEKPELVERVARLWQEDSQTRKGLENMSMDELCKICMDAPVECVMLECGHMATCTACGKQLSECPICRQFVVRVVRTFRA